MINTSGLVSNTRNRETCFEAGFTVSYFSFRVIKSIAWFRRIRLWIRHSDVQSITRVTFICQTRPIHFICSSSFNKESTYLKLESVILFELVSSYKVCRWHLMLLVCLWAMSFRLSSALFPSSFSLLRESPTPLHPADEQTLAARHSKRHKWRYQLKKTVLLISIDNSF